MANSYPVTLDVNKSKYTINTPVTLREGDAGTANIVATINDNGLAYSGMSKATFFAQKPDGTVVASDPATTSGNIIRYTINKNLTSTSGHIITAYFLINDSVSTENFTINIQPGLVLHGPATDYIPGLNAMTGVWQATIKTWEDKFNDLKAQIENTDYSKVIKDTMTQALDEAKAQYQKDFNAAIADVNSTVQQLKDKGVEADKQIAVLKGKQNDAVTVANSLQSTVDELNKKILDIDKWLDTLHTEFTAKNETYMKAMQADLTKKLADMKATSDSALNTVKGNISTAQTDINELDSKITELKAILKNVSDSVASINIPQIKEDVDTANANAELALQEVVNKANKDDLTQLATDLINDNLVNVYSDGTAPSIVKLNAPVLSVTPDVNQVSIKITDTNMTGVKNYDVEYSSNGTTWTSKTVIGKTTTIVGLTNGTTYSFKVKAVGDGVSYSDSDFSGITKASPSSAPAEKLKTPTIAVSVNDATISYTITDTNTAGIKNYVISGIGSERTVTSKTGDIITTPSATYMVAVKAVSSDISKYTDSDYSATVKAQLYTPNPIDKDFTVSVTDTTATVTDNGKTIDRTNEYLIISKSGGGVVSTGKAGENSTVLTGLTASTKYASGSFWLGYKGTDGVESGKIAVPEFTTSASENTGGSAESMNIDFSKKKQGDNLPYKAYKVIDALHSSSGSQAVNSYDKLDTNIELTSNEYSKLGSFTSPTDTGFVNGDYPVPILVEIDIQNYPVSMKLNLQTAAGNPFAAKSYNPANYANTIITNEPSGLHSIITIPEYFKNEMTVTNGSYTINISDNSSKLQKDNKIFVVVAFNVTAQFYWDNTNSITYPTEQTNSLEYTVPESELLTDSIMPTAYSMAPMALSAVSSNIIQKRLSENFVKRPELNSYVPLTTLTDYITATDVANKYIPRSDVEKDYIKKSELNSLVDLSKYTTTVDMNTAISKAVTTAITGLAKTTDVNSAISTSLTSYLKTADLKAENYKAGFHSDWYGTDAQYQAITTKDGNVNYHTKEE